MRYRQFLPLAVAAAAGALVWACGSDSDGDLVTAPSDGGASSTSSSSSGGTTSSSGTTSSASSSGASGGTDGGDGGTSSGALGGDGGVDPPDAGPGGDLTKLSCGATSCALPAQQCCVSEVAGGGNLGYGCIAASDAGCPQPAGGGDVTSMKCTAQANCPASTVCCVRQTNNGAASECKASCNQNEAQLCDPKAATTGCPQQDPCSSNNIDDWGLPNTYATCGGQGN